MADQKELQKRIRYSAGLWLEGEDLDPEAVTECLGVEPCSSWKRGDRTRNPEKPVHDRGGWGIRVRGEWGESLDSTLSELFSWFEPSEENESSEEELAKLSAQYEGHITIGLFYQWHHICSPTLGIPAEWLKKISDLNFPIYVSVYPCSDPESKEESACSCSCS